jgi:hypothetical protein
MLKSILVLEKKTIITRVNILKLIDRIAGGRHILTDEQNTINSGLHNIYRGNFFFENKQD